MECKAELTLVTDGEHVGGEFAYGERIELVIDGVSPS
jgi:hypothetical protein